MIGKLANTDAIFWELKQAAKWSLNLPERIQAIQELGNLFGKDALPALHEVRDTTVHDQVKAMCIEVIKSAGKVSANGSPAVGKEIVKRKSRKKSPNQRRLIRTTRKKKKQGTAKQRA